MKFTFCEKVSAAAFGAGKYMNMSDEEKQKLSATLKGKAHKLKDEAENSVDKRRIILVN